MENKFFIPKDAELLDPKMDSTFKTLFTRDSRGSGIALKSLVSAIIGNEPASVEVINNELPKEVLYAKEIRLDLQCKMEDGSRIDIEIQTCPDGDNLRKRSLYYGCRMLSSMSTSGKHYFELPKVYQVMFTNFTLFKESRDYMQQFRMKSGDIELCDTLQVIFIQMPLLKEETIEEKNLNEIEKWVIFLRDSTDKDKRDLLNRIMATDRGIKEAGEILMTISADEREWAIQESRYKGRMDYESGLAASHAKGVEEGIEQGKLEDARSMKAKNLPIELITEITGLTSEQVAAL